MILQQLLWVSDRLVLHGCPSYMYQAFTKLWRGQLVFGCTDTRKWMHVSVNECFVPLRREMVECSDFGALFCFLARGSSASERVVWRDEKRLSLDFLDGIGY